MPPLPTFSQSSGSAESQDRHVINYVAILLANWRYKRIPTIYGLGFDGRKTASASTSASGGSAVAPAMEKETGGDEAAASFEREKGMLLELWSALERGHRNQLVTFMLVRGRRDTRTRSSNASGMDGGGNEQMMSTLRGLEVHSRALEDDPSLGLSIPSLRLLLPDLSSSISSLLSHPPFTPFGPVDAEVLSLAQWFKNNYMRWIDPIPCPLCGGKTRGVGTVSPTPAERGDGAGRVELHNCENENRPCGGSRRFARYGKVAALVKTREGRCGEWAQLFYTFLRVKGIESRYIWNSEDHVWSEYWSPTLRHWVHVDPCEAATNKPLLYARGWGKKQAYCLAFGPYGAEDVTRAYVDDYEGACRGRRRARGWREYDLRRALYAHTVALRLKVSFAERARLGAMDDLQQRWISDEAGRLQEAERMDLGGRISGPEEWRKMRNEVGAGFQSAKKPKFTVRHSLKAPKVALEPYGNAQLGDEGQGITLTTSPSQTSAVYNPEPVPQNQSFRCAITFRLTSPPGAGEADGIALVFADEKKMGLGGFGLGYDGVGGEGDFAIEVDTYRTQDHAADPPTPHISLHSPPKAHHRFSVSCTKAGQIPFLSDGRAYNLEVFYEASERRVRGYLDLPNSDSKSGSGSGSRSKHGESIHVIDICLPGPAAPPSRSGEESAHWFVGVSGSCGGLWQKQEILEWEIDLIDLHGDEAGELTGGQEDVAAQATPADAEEGTGAVGSQEEVMAEVEVEKDVL